ncbi:MAG: hypothetical protein U5K29_15320 [Acidimicrobiales bacterium]|nr:hypothetical protein [Acidimicrobiales bacterium]
MQAIDDGGADGGTIPSAPVTPVQKATPMLLVAVVAGAAGLIHAAVAGAHDGQRSVAVLLALAAGLLVGGAVLALWWLVTETGPGWLHHRSVPPVAAVLVLVLAAPAIVVGLEPDGGSVAAADEASEPADTELPAQGIAFTEQPSDAGRAPGSSDGDAAVDDDAVDDDADAGHQAHADGPVISLYDPRVTPEQRHAARQLIDDTRAGMERFTDIDRVIAEGYLSIGDGVTGFEHFVHPGYRADDAILDPDRIESIVARVNPDGSRDIVSAMYLLPPGSTMDDVPDIAGALTTWHDHQNLCWEDARVVATTGEDGSCPRGVFRPTAPMIHVWLEPHPCGPFAGLEGHGGGCGHEH